MHKTFALVPDGLEYTWKKKSIDCSGVSKDDPKTNFNCEEEIDIPALLGFTLQSGDVYVITSLIWHSLVITTGAHATSEVGYANTKGRQWFINMCHDAINIRVGHKAEQLPNTTKNYIIVHNTENNHVPVAPLQNKYSLISISDCV